MRHNISFLIILFQCLAFYSCAEKRDTIKLTGCDNCSFELIKDDLSLDQNVVLKPGSIEEAFIRLYLFEEYEKYADYYRPDEVFPFLGIKGKGRKFLKDELRFKLILKFNFEKEGESYCFSRWRITNQENNHMIFHETFRKENNQWKALGSFERVTDNKMLKKLKTSHLEDLLVYGNNDAPALSALLAVSKDPKTGYINYQQLSQNYSLKQNELVNYNYEEKNHFPVAWLHKMWALYK